MTEELVSTVSARYPGIDLRLISAYSGHLQQWLDSGELDLSLLYNLADQAIDAVTPLAVEELWAVAPPDAGLSPILPVPWEQVLEQPLILPVAGHGLRAVIDRALAAHGDARPAIAIEVNSLRLQKLMVRGGRGWTVLPSGCVAPEIRQGLWSGAPLSDPRTTREVVLGMARAQNIPPPVHAVAAEVVNIVRQLISDGVWEGAAITMDSAPTQAAPTS